MNTDLLKADFLKIANEHMGEGGLFVYERSKLTAAAKSLLKIDMPYGMTVRYAAKANGHAEIISLFDALGLSFDASSVNEALRLIDYGVKPGKISLSSQILRPTKELERILSLGVLPVATSLQQIDVLAGLGSKHIAIRVNPGIGSGHNNRTNVGGPASSFGIWHEDLAKTRGAAKANGQIIDRLHTHIGSGADPGIWRSVIQKSLEIVGQLPDVKILDIGGGYKIARMPDEESTDMKAVCDIFAEELKAFDANTGREIKLEIEPGTYLTAMAGTLLGRVEEMTETDKYKFLKLNVGMNALLRPSLYGAQHPIEVLNDSKETNDYVVVGPCCESGDILTPIPGDPEGILPRKLNKARIGGIVAIGGVGAYGKTMAASSYNDIPEATEVMV